MWFFKKKTLTQEQKLIKSSDRDNLLLGYIFQAFSLALSSYCFYRLGTAFDKQSSLFTIPYSTITLNLTGAIFGLLAFFLDFKKSSTAKTANAQLAKGDLKGAKASKKLGVILVCLSVLATASTGILEILNAKEELRLSNLAKAKIPELEKSIKDYESNIESLGSDIKEKQKQQEDAKKNKLPQWQKNTISNDLKDLRKSKLDYENKKEKAQAEKDIQHKLITINEDTLIFSGIEINTALLNFTLYYVVLGFVAFGALVEYVMFNCKHNVSFIKTDKPIKQDSLLKIWSYNKLGLEKYLNVIDAEYQEIKQYDAIENKGHALINNNQVTFKDNAFSLGDFTKGSALSSNVSYSSALPVPQKIESVPKEGDSSALVPIDFIEQEEKKLSGVGYLIGDTVSSTQTGKIDASHRQIQLDILTGNTICKFSEIAKKYVIRRGLVGTAILNPLVELGLVSKENGKYKLIEVMSLEDAENALPLNNEGNESNVVSLFS